MPTTTVKKSQARAEEMKFVRGKAGLVFNKAGTSEIDCVLYYDEANGIDFNNLLNFIAYITRYPKGENAEEFKQGIYYLSTLWEKNQEEIEEIIKVAKLNYFKKKVEEVENELAKK